MKARVYEDWSRAFRNKSKHQESLFTEVLFRCKNDSVGEIDFGAQTPRNLRSKQSSFLNSPTLSTLLSDEQVARFHDIY